MLFAFNSLVYLFFNDLFILEGGRVHVHGAEGQREREREYSNRLPAGHGARLGTLSHKSQMINLLSHSGTPVLCFVFVGLVGFFKSSHL